MHLSQYYANPEGFFAFSLLVCCLSHFLFVCLAPLGLRCWAGDSQVAAMQAFHCSGISSCRAWASSLWVSVVAARGSVVSAPRL